MNFKQIRLDNELYYIEEKKKRKIIPRSFDKVAILCQLFEDLDFDSFLITSFNELYLD